MTRSARFGAGVLLVPAQAKCGQDEKRISRASLGSHNRRTCCPGPTRLLANIELRSSTLSQGQIRRIQAVAKKNEVSQLADQLIELARGAANQGVANRDTDSLLKAMHALRKIFPEAKPTPDPRDAEAAAQLVDSLEQIASQKPLPSPSLPTPAPPRIQRNRKKGHK